MSANGEEDFDTIRERAAAELEQDHYAGFIVVGIDDNGECGTPHVATDGNRIPPEISREQAIGTMVAQVLRDRIPMTLGDVVLKLAGVDVQPVSPD